MQWSVHELMTRDVATVNPSTPLTRVRQYMVDTRYKSIPVIDGDRLVGIISREDVVRAMECAATKRAP